MCKLLHWGTLCSSSLKTRWMWTWFTQEFCTLFSSGLLCLSNRFMSRPSLVWATPDLHPLVLSEVDRRRGGEANATSISKWVMSPWLNTVEDRSPPPEKNEKVQTVIMLVCRITGYCKLLAAILKPMFVHAIAFISTILQHAWNIYAHQHLLCDRAYTYAWIIQRSISLHHVTLSVDQKLQMKRIKVWVKQQFTGHIRNKSIIELYKKYTP